MLLAAGGGAHLYDVRRVASASTRAQAVAELAPPEPRAVAALAQRPAGASPTCFAAGQGVLVAAGGGTLILAGPGGFGKPELCDTICSSARSCGLRTLEVSRVGADAKAGRSIEAASARIELDASLIDGAGGGNEERGGRLSRPPRPIS